MTDAAGLLSKLRDAYTKNDLTAGKALLGQIKVSLSPLDVRSLFYLLKCLQLAARSSETRILRGKWG